MPLTDDQRDAVRYPSHIAIKACPGSGKTRALVAKAIRCLEETRGTTRHVACITYTNAAANEVSRRVGALLCKEDADRLHTATIHAFCVRHLLRPYSWASQGYTSGFEIAAPDSDRYKTHARAAAAVARLSARALDSFEHIGRLSDGSAVVPPLLTDAVIVDFWRRMRGDRLIDFPTLLFESANIGRRLPAVLRGIAARYSWILVDEFQDTSDAQLNILKALAGHGTSRFMIVGDPHQSIFRFAGARPEYFDDLAANIGAHTGVSFADNFRSSRRIVAVAEGIITRAPPMRAIGDNRDFGLVPAWVECRDAADAITGTILPELAAHDIALGDTAILGSWFFDLYRLGRELHGRGVPVVGPGARPYRRRHLVVPIAECLAACATVGHAGSSHWVGRELLDLLRQLSVDASIGGDGRDLSELVTLLIRDARRINRGNPDAGQWLVAIAEAVGLRLREAALVSEPERRKIIQSGASVVEEAGEYGGLDSLTVECLAEFVRPTNHVHLLTVHKSKGREFEAAIILDAHDGRFPHYTARTPEEVEDGRRLFYVAMTRAHKALYFLTGHSDPRNRPTRFLTEGALPLRRLTA